MHIAKDMILDNVFDENCLYYECCICILWTVTTAANTNPATEKMVQKEQQQSHLRTLNQNWYNRSNSYEFLHPTWYNVCSAVCSAVTNAVKKINSLSLTRKYELGFNRNKRCVIPFTCITVLYCAQKHNMATFLFVFSFTRKATLCCSMK
jgi:hypothetical protein